MSDGWEKDPEYQQAYAQYLAAKTVAEKDGDEVGVLKAENTWLTARGDLKEKITARELATKRMDEVLETAKKECPDVPASLYEHLKDPDALLTIARELQDKITSTKDSAEKKWGKPAAAPTGAADTARRNSQMDELVARVNRGEKAANEEYKRKVWSERVMPFVERQR